MNKLASNRNKNLYIFIKHNALKYVVWKMAAILSRPQCVKGRTMVRNECQRNICLVMHFTKTIRQNVFSWVVWLKVSMAGWQWLDTGKNKIILWQNVSGIILRINAFESLWHLFCSSLYCYWSLIVLHYITHNISYSPPCTYVLGLIQFRFVYLDDGLCMWSAINLFVYFNFKTEIEPDCLAGLPHWP